MSKIEPVAWQLPNSDKIITADLKEYYGVVADHWSIPLYATDPNPLQEMIERLAVALDAASRMLGTYGEPLDGDVILLYEAREMLK
jgi:hypothetical protein